MLDKYDLAQKIIDITGISPNLVRLKIVEDTSDWVNISAGNVVFIEGKYYLIRGNMREPRFGIDDQPKLWVFHAIDLDNGDEKIIKTVFYEEFIVHISILKIRCYRSPDKEGKVLELTHGDKRFMQGKPCYDTKGNNVRIIDYIHGKSLFRYIPEIHKEHEPYFFEDIPYILRKLFDSFLAIRFLHENKLCHGDIRNDHIYIESATGDFRWIDFDLAQDLSDFDLWSFGNVINYVLAKGIRTYDSVLKGKEFPDSVKDSLKSTDCSAFYTYRIMNLQKLYPYIPQKLSNILQHFTINPVSYYKNSDEFIDSYYDMLESEF